MGKSRWIAQSRYTIRKNSKASLRRFNKENIMSKSKWIVRSEFTTREECEAQLKKYNCDIEDYEIGDFDEIEIGVIRGDNTLGQSSYGWPNLDKIILFGDDSFDSPATKKDIEWCEKVAKVTCDALNKAGL